MSSAEKDIGNQFAFDMNGDVDEEETNAAVNNEQDLDTLSKQLQYQTADDLSFDK